MAYFPLNAPLPDPDEAVEDSESEDPEDYKRGKSDALSPIGPVPPPAHILAHQAATIPLGSVSSSRRTATAFSRNSDGATSRPSGSVTTP